MRTCPKCGDYYADDLLAFCLADGTPLVGVIPHGEVWSDSLRVVEEKERALRKQRRRLRWRRVLLSATTTLVVSMVVCVVVVNGFIYLTQGPEENRRADASTPELPKANPTTTPTIITTPDITRETTPTPTPTPTHEGCSDADRSRESKVVVRVVSRMWQDDVEGERDRVTREHSKNGVKANAELSGTEYKSSVQRKCSAATVTVSHTWTVFTPRGTEPPVHSSQTFACAKVSGAWGCHKVNSR